MLFQILGSLEGLATEVALMRLERNVHPDMGSNMITLDGRGTTIAPLARQIQIVGTLATDMTFANVVL